MFSFKHIWLAPIVFLAACQATTQKSVSVQHTLPSQHGYEMSCEEAQTMTSAYTPAHLYKGIKDCVDQDKYSEAVNLYVFAGTYLFYDKLRVTDKSAHQVGTGLKLGLSGSLSDEQNEHLQTTLSESIRNNGTASFCPMVKKLGVPSYKPMYMVTHGIKAYMNQPLEKSIAVDFSVEEGWHKTLSTYLHCEDE